MAQRNTKPTKEEKVKARQKKANKRTLIIFICLVAAIILAIVTFKVIIPNINKDKPDDRAEISQNYTYVKYGKGEIPADFKEILDVAEKDEAALCKKRGVAFKVGNRKFSQTTLLMYYIDAYNVHLVKASEDLDTLGYSTEDMHFDFFPEYIKYGEETNWGEMLLEEARNNLATNCYLFDLAIENGYKMSDIEIEDTAYAYEKLKTYENYYENGITGMFKKSYNTEDITYELYAAHRIMTFYAASYKNYLTEKEGENIKNSELAERLKGNEKNFQTIAGRILPLVKGNEGIEAVKDEETFLKYASNYLGENSDAEAETDATYTNYQRVLEAYGDIVADYVFSQDRKAGEISTVKNDAYEFLIYIEKPAYFETSVSCVFIYKPYESTDEEELKKEKELYLEDYNMIAEKNPTKQGFNLFSTNFSPVYPNCPYGEADMRINSYDIKVDKWLRDPARKHGDHTIMFLDTSVVFIYFDKVNDKDFDWTEKVKAEILEEKFQEKYSFKNDSAYKTDFKEDSKTYIYDRSHEAINIYIQNNILSKNKETTTAAE